MANTSSLRPNSNSNRCLLSTPAQVIGEFEAAGLLVTHAWPELMAPNARKHHFHPGPSHRRFLIVAFETNEPESSEDRVSPLPNYHWIGDFYAVCLAVFFGKRVDNHGLIETQGMFCVPSYDSVREIGTYYLPPYDPKPRNSFGFDLNLSNLQAISSLLHLLGNEQAIDTLFTAGNFYLRALRIYEEQPEMAYIDFVTAGEVLSNYFTFSDEELFDRDFLDLLEEVRTQLPAGCVKAESIKSRMYQVRRRFRLTLGKLLNESFFATSESAQPWASLTSDSIDSAIVAAYDLRSRYVHTGERFGQWIKCTGGFLEEKQLGTPIVADKDFQRILSRAPTIVGIERILRHSLIRFIHKELCPIDPQLD